ncbi:MAG: lipopolysaccharide heptosyltransferase I [Burkholderiales bacterium]|nr:lipopolysaccharide heptosyltransferase I [Burkholderiales bacterium]
MKILIVKTSSMGDVVHTLPTISDIAEHRAGAIIDWVVEKPFAALPAMHPAVRRVIPIAWRKWRKSLWQRATRAAIAEARRALQAEHYDLVLDLQGLVKSALWAVQAHGPRAGYDRASAREPLAAMFYGRTAGVPKALHAVERSRRLAAYHLGYDIGTTPARFALTAPVGGWRPEASGYAVLITGASREEKLWPEPSWLAVAAMLREAGYGLVWLWGSPAEQARCQRLAATAGGDVPPFLTVADAAAVLAGAAVCVGLDTGFSHIAAAFGVPTIGIYCDHEPGLVGITGQGYVASLGGRGQVPTVAQVQERVAPAIAHPRAAQTP